MVDADRYQTMREMRQHGATLEQIAERFQVTAEGVRKILLARGERIRGRPCPAVVQGQPCGGSSRVLKVWQEEDGGFRRRECLRCGYHWLTLEVDYAGVGLNSQMKTKGR